MTQIGEIFEKKLLNALPDSRREMQEKLKQVMTQTKSCTESVQNAPSAEKNQTLIGTLTSVPSWKNPRIQN